jgi:hypothetical protein
MSQAEAGDRAYQASGIKRRQRATRAEMERRAEFLIDYAEEHGPVTVRQLYYQAEVAGLPGIDKTESGYCKIQYQVLDLRREGRLSYSHIADATRWMRKPRTYSSVEDAIEATARTYRRALWDDADSYPEIWVEKDALAGVIYPVTSRWDVPLMVARGFSSETFCYEAVAARDGDDRVYHVYYLGDFDRAGRDAAKALEEKLTRFAAEDGIEVVFEQLAVTLDQIEDLDLPTRGPKRGSGADKNWPHDFACELDAIPPDYMRDLVEEAIKQHVNHSQLATLRVAEEDERQLLKVWAKSRSRTGLKSSPQDRPTAPKAVIRLPVASISMTKFGKVIPITIIDYSLLGITKTPSVNARKTNSNSPQKPKIARAQGP